VTVAPARSQPLAPAVKAGAAEATTGSATAQLGPAAAPQSSDPLAPALRGRASMPAQDAAGELRLLERAQQALRADPARALAIAEQHRRMFTRGQFAQEREMIAIEALVALGQTRRAAARAEAFARRYPDSSHLPHLRDLVHF
jgi:hypothetical protein